MKSQFNAVQRGVLRCLLALPAIGLPHFALAQVPPVRPVQPTVAQPAPVRVLRYTPADSGTPGSVITVMFDRAVAPLLGQSIDANKVMRLDPAVRGVFEWRDPITLRFLPDEPFAPGTRVAVNVDTAAIASNLARTGRPYTFTVRFPGATPIARLVDGSEFPNKVGPLPTFQVWYSAPVDLESLVANSRIELDERPPYMRRGLPDDCKRTIRLKPVSQRPMTRRDVMPYNQTRQFDPDTMATRFVRIVDLVPVDSLPPGCEGRWYVEPLDPQRPNDRWMYRVATYPAFTVTSVWPCAFARDCDPDGLRIEFSAPVSNRVAALGIKVSPQLAAPRWMQDENGRSEQFAFNERLTPRDSFTVTLDTTMRDIFGRKLQGRTSFTVMARDRVPGAKQQTGLVTFSRGGKGPTMAVRTVNVDTIALTVTRIPDSLTAELLTVSAEGRYVFLSRIAPQLTDTFSVRVPIRGKFNTELNTLISLPENLYSPTATSLAAVRVSIAARTYAPDSQPPPPPVGADGKTRVLPPVNVRAPLGRMEHDLSLIVHRSDLLAHAKIAADEGAAFVTTRSGAPVNNAAVKLFGAGPLPLAEGYTDASGLAQFVSLRAKAPTPVANAVVRIPSFESVRYLKVSRGDDVLILPVNAEIPQPFWGKLDAYSFGAPGGTASKIRGLVTPDRNLYRPGEKVFTKVFVRVGTSGLITVPAGDSVRVTLIRGSADPYGGTTANASDSIATWRSTINEFGTAADSVHVPATAQLGTYRLQAELQSRGRWEKIQNVEIRVDEYRAPEHLVALASDTVFRTARDTVNFNLEGAYLFGAPMAGAKINWTVSVTNPPNWSIKIPGAEGYSIGQNNWWQQPNAAAPKSFQSEAVLDRNGRATLPFPTLGDAFARTAAIRVSAAVTDLSNQVVTANAGTPVYASNLFIGARYRNAGAAETGRPHAIDIITVRKTGERVASVLLRAIVLRRTSEHVGGMVPRMDPYIWSADTVQRFTLTSSSDSVSLQFTPIAAGLYDIVIQATDDAGRTSTTNIARNFAPPQPAPKPPRPNAIALALATQNKTGARFSLGDTANVSFESPFEQADAWVTYERESVVEQQRIRVRKGTNTIRVPITTKFAPNIWVGVTLFPRQGAALIGADSLSDLIRVGYTNLRVDSTANLLRVSIAPLKSPAAPGDSVSVQVRVKDKFGVGGVRSEVALWAVDEGLLSMTGFRTPDLLAAFDRQGGVASTFRSTFSTLPWLNPTGPVMPGVNSQFVFAALAAAMSVSNMTATQNDMRLNTILAPNADPDALRSVFRPTAFYVASAQTDPAGLATITAKLPDNLTTFRLMATAIGTGSRYGSGETTLVVTKRVVLRAALPRFVRYGDTLSANATLNLRERGNAQLLVSANFSGTLLTGDSTRSAVVSDTTGTSVGFGMIVPEKTSADMTRVVFRAQDLSGGDGDAVATSLPIKPTGTPRSHTIVGTVRDSGTISFDLPAGIDIARSAMTFGIGTSPIVAMRSHYERLRAYTYLSSDRVVTAARALITLANAERTLGEPIVTRDSVAILQDIQSAVNTMILRQGSNGEFAYFSGYQFTMGPWFSAFAGTFLLEAQRAGAAVPALAFTRINKLLTGTLRDKSLLPDTAVGSPVERKATLQGYLGARVAIAQYLRTAGAPDIATEDELLRDEKSLSWEDRVVLVAILYTRAERAAQARTMLEQSWSAVGVAGKRVDIPDSLGRYSWWFPSHVRPAARLLTTTMTVLPDHPLLGALYETIVQQNAVGNGWSWNVQDHGAAIEAMARFVVAQRGDSRTRVAIRGSDGKLLFTRDTQGAGRDAFGAGTTREPLNGFVEGSSTGAVKLRTSLRMETEGGVPAVRDTPLYYAITVYETPLARPVTPDIAGLVVERWYENFETGAPLAGVDEGQLVRVRLRVTAPNDRQFVALEDLLPAGLEPVDLSSQFVAPWEFKEIHDDRVFYFARQLRSGTHNASYVARATTSGTFVKPPAHAEEMYNAAVQGRSDGGTFVVRTIRR